MREVFGTGRQRNGWHIGLTIIILIFFLMAALGIRSVKAGASREAVQILEQNIKSAAVECYAVEGRYPENIQYLEDNYGVWIDEKRYAVYYENQGENLVPDIRVIQLQ